VIVCQPLINKIYKSQPPLIPNLFEGTVETQELIRKNERVLALRQKWFAVRHTVKNLTEE
jgi:hypothetical protein